MKRVGGMYEPILELDNFLVAFHRAALGNSPRIAQQSYLLVTEDDFAKAAGVAKVMTRAISQN